MCFQYPKSLTLESRAFDFAGRSKCVTAQAESPEVSSEDSGGGVSGAVLRLLHKEPHVWVPAIDHSLCFWFGDIPPSSLVGCLTLSARWWQTTEGKGGPWPRAPSSSGPHAPLGPHCEPRENHSGPTSPRAYCVHWCSWARFPPETIYVKEEFRKGSPLFAKPLETAVWQIRGEGGCGIKCDSNPKMINYIWIFIIKMCFSIRRIFFIIIVIGKAEKRINVKTFACFLSLYVSCTFEEHSYNFLSFFSASWRGQPAQKTGWIPTGFKTFFFPFLYRQ